MTTEFPLLLYEMGQREQLVAQQFLRCTAPTRRQGPATARNQVPHSAMRL